MCRERQSRGHKCIQEGRLFFILLLPISLKERKTPTLPIFFPRKERKKERKTKKKDKKKIREKEKRETKTLNQKVVCFFVCIFNWWNTSRVPKVFKVVTKALHYTQINTRAGAFKRPTQKNDIRCATSTIRKKNNCCCCCARTTRIIIVFRTSSKRSLS